MVSKQVFVASPTKSRPVHMILYQNRDKLISFLQSFQTDRSDDTQFNDEKQYLIKQIRELQPLPPLWFVSLLSTTLACFSTMLSAISLASQHSYLPSSLTLLCVHTVSQSPPWAFFQCHLPYYNSPFFLVLSCAGSPYLFGKNETGWRKGWGEGDRCFTCELCACGWAFSRLTLLLQLKLLFPPNKNGGTFDCFYCFIRCVMCSRRFEVVAWVDEEEGGVVTGIVFVNYTF